MAPPLASAPVLPLSPPLALQLETAATLGGLGSLATLARPALVTVTFNVGVASGSIGPSIAIGPSIPGREEIGLMGPVTVRLSLQRIVTITVQTDAGLLMTEQFASGGLKVPAGWYPFDRQAQVTIFNPSTSFYVCGQLVVPVWYVKRALWDVMRAELRQYLPPADALATGMV
jgi:hypothetical protein